MSLNLVSPGVKVREVDLTIGRADAAAEQVGAIAGPFELGPVDVPILIETEQDLLKTFGKPLSTDAQYDYWLSASSYLSYGGILRVVRSDGDTLKNATAGTAVKVKSYEDYVNNRSSDTTWNFAARSPGRWANNLKVCTIDGAADQILTLSSTSGLTAGMAVTQSIDGRVNVGSGSTSSYTGIIRGIITEVETDTSISIKITDTVDSNGTYAAAEYEENGSLSFLNPSTSTTVPTVGIATTAGVIDTAFDITISGIATAGVQIGDSVTVTGGNSTVSAGTTVVSIAAGVITVDKAITGISTAGDGAIFTFSRDGAPVTVNTNTITARTSAGISTVSITSGTLKDWYGSQTLSLTNSTVFWKSIAPKPGTSEYASQRNAKNDEIHVVVVDDTGSVSGVAGNILEKHLSLSKSLDGKVSPSEGVYYKDYIANSSENIFAGIGGTMAVSSGTSGGDTTTFTPTGTGNFGTNAQGVTYAVEGSKTYTLTNGENYSAAGGFGCSLEKIISSYELFKNKTEVPINFLINGPSGGTSIFESQAKAKKLVEIAELRRDCIACISPHRAGVVNVANSDTQTDNIVQFFDGIQSSSFAVFDSGYKYMFDRFTNSFRYVPCNADVAGLMARTSLNQFSWFSPAGTSRGALNGAVKLAYNPTQAQRDIIYPKRINPIVAQSGAGIILFGDRTGLAKASAFDRINVRRLFLTIEEAIENAAKDQLFELNDVITRSNFVNIVEPFLRDVKAKRGVTDFVVICDETNNTPDVIDSNQFKADIFVKPARSINFIGLSFVATRTGVSFEEVVGNV